MKRFTVYRSEPPATYLKDGHANPVDQPQFEGVVFSDGTVCVRWLTTYRSHSIWGSLQDLLAVHGHPEYGTRVEWLDDPAPVQCANCAEAEEPDTIYGYIPLGVPSMPSVWRFTGHPHHDG